MINTDECVHSDALTRRKLVDVFIADHCGDGRYIIGKFLIAEACWIEQFDVLNVFVVIALKVHSDVSWIRQVLPLCTFKKQIEAPSQAHGAGFGFGSRPRKSFLDDPFMGAFIARVSRALEPAHGAACAVHHGIEAQKAGPVAHSKVDQVVAVEL